MTPRSMRFSSPKRLILMAGALLLAALLAIPASGAALAASRPQEPPPAAGELIILNHDREFIERWKVGWFHASPVFNQRVDVLYFALRHPDTGEWLTPMTRVIGGEKEHGGGWEYSFLYSSWGDDSKPEDQFLPDPDSAYILVLLAGNEADGDLTTFHAVVPVYQPNGLWDRVLRALNPGRWARAIAGWFIEGAHGTLCGVVEKVTGDEIANCRVGG